MKKTGVVIVRLRVGYKVRNCNFVAGRQGEFARTRITLGMVGSEVKEFTPPACGVAVYSRLQYGNIEHRMIELNVEAVLGSIGNSTEKIPCPISQTHAGVAMTPTIAPFAVTRKYQGVVGSRLAAMEIGSYSLTLGRKMVILVRCEGVCESDLWRREKEDCYATIAAKSGIPMKKTKRQIRFM
jgi:hypothetical protein